MPSKTKRTSGEKRSVEGEKKKKRNKADPTSVSDAEGAQDPEKDRPKGHKEDSSDHDGDAAIENTEDASSYDEKDDDESAQATGKTTVISTVTTIKTRSERVGIKKALINGQGKRRVYEKDIGTVETKRC